jgi:hypothetical protein
VGCTHRLRYVLAWDHALCRAVTGVFVRTVLGFLRRRARRAGVHGGVYVEGEDGALHFQEGVPPTDEEMDRLLGTIERRIQRLLALGVSPSQFRSGQRGR